MALSRYPTTTFPHIPLHFPLLSVEWNLQRNRNVPALLKVKEVEVPAAIVVLFDQFFEVAVTVWEPETAFHVTFAPFATDTCVGIHL